MDRPQDMLEARGFLLKELPRIERIIASICRRSGLDGDASEEFAAEVKLRLVEDDCAIIRAFQNRSSFDVYIAAVIKRILIDCRNREWGKWRASANAERCGALAVELERLLYRDWRSVADATALLVARHGEAARGDIEQLVMRIPARVPRRNVSIEEAANVAAPATDMDVIREETARRVSHLISTFVDELPSEDQLILRLHFEAGMSVAQISRALHLDQQSVYRLFYRHFRTLRTQLLEAGMSKGDVEDLIGRNVTSLDFGLKKAELRPSEETENDESATAAGKEIS